MSDWVGASNIAIKRFGRDVCGPTNAKFYAFAAAGLSLPPHRGVRGHSSSSVLPVPAFTPELFFESFGRAQAVVGVMNAILAGPITVFLAAIFVFVVVDWVLIFTNPAPTTGGSAWGAARQDTKTGPVRLGRRQDSRSKKRHMFHNNHCFGTQTMPPTIFKTNDQGFDCLKH